MCISRRMPNSQESVWLALSKAKYTRDHPPIYGNILSAKTTARLDIIYESFREGRNTLKACLVISTQATRDKEEMMMKLLLLNSHYIQNLNFMIADKVFPESYRSCFGISNKSEAVPNQRTERRIEMLSKNIIDGEPLMIVLGGKPIPYPLLKDIQDGLALLQKKNIFQENALVDTDAAKNVMKKLLPEAYAVARKIWDEVDTYFDLKQKSSARVDSRVWGMVFVNSGNPIIVQGIIATMNEEEIMPLTGAKAMIVETDEWAFSLLQGNLKLKTNATGMVNICISMIGFEDRIIQREMETKKNIDLGLVMMERLKE